MDIDVKDRKLLECFTFELLSKMAFSIIMYSCLITQTPDAAVTHIKTRCFNIFLLKQLLVYSIKNLCNINWKDLYSTNDYHVTGTAMLGLVKSCIGTKFTSQFGDLIAVRILVHCLVTLLYDFICLYIFNLICESSLEVGK